MIDVLLIGNGKYMTLKTNESVPLMLHLVKKYKMDSHLSWWGYSVQKTMPCKLWIYGNSIAKCTPFIPFPKKMSKSNMRWKCINDFTIDYGFI